jgi:hypothetical protein
MDYDFQGRRAPVLDTAAADLEHLYPGLFSLPSDVLRLLFSPAYLNVVALVPCRSSSSHSISTLACFLSSGSQWRLLQWERANGCPWDEMTCAAAARAGHLAVLQWARAKRCPWDECTCRFAAKEGNLQILQWARANGCLWDEGTCEAAAAGGHLEVLLWARLNGCLWNENVTRTAANLGHLKVLQWAGEHGCPLAGDICVIAAHHGRLEMLQWAHANGCTWDESVCHAAANGHLEVLQWARANGCSLGRYHKIRCHRAQSSARVEVGARKRLPVAIDPAGCHAQDEVSRLCRGQGAVKRYQKYKSFMLRSCLSGRGDGPCASRRGGLFEVQRFEQPS